MTISDVIQLYKQNFEAVKNERYKWVAISWYKAHWDIEAPDFARMFSVAFSKHGNLLNANRYFPYSMACEFAEQYPEDARGLFRQLYDESISLAQRYRTFRERFIEYVNERMEKEEKQHLNHYQDLHAVSVYLTSEYPEKYCFYKASICEGFRNLVNLPEESGAARSEVWKLENCNSLSNAIIESIKQDPEVIELSQNRLGEDCYQDEYFRILYHEIMRYGWILAKEKQKKVQLQTVTDEEDG